MEISKYKILDLSTLYPGPFSSHLLSLQGFKVTKVEDARNPDALRQMWPTKSGLSVAYQKLNENKQIVEIDYREDKDLAKLRDLIKESDVLIENFRPGRLDKLGLGYADCQKLNPKIVYCSITGFGRGHPLEKKAAHDINILGLCGYFNLNNNFQVPPIQFADVLTAYEAAMQITLGLLTGKSSWVEVSMLKSITNSMILTSSSEDFLKRSLSPKEFVLWGNHLCYSLYETKDGKYMALAAIENAFWIDFCTAVNRPEFTNSQFETDPEIRDNFKNLIAGKTQKEWIEMSLECFTPVMSYIESKKNGFI